MKGAEAGRALLVESLSERAREMRLAEEKCRGAYRQPGPLRDASERLADVYARAAEVFESELGSVGMKIADEAASPLSPLPPRLRCPGGMALCPVCGGAKPRVGPDRCWEGWHDLPAHTGHDFEQVSGGHCGVCGYGHK